jgi:hypothetical protein
MQFTGARDLDVQKYMTPAEYAAVDVQSTAGAPAVEMVFHVSVDKVYLPEAVGFPP